MVPTMRVTPALPPTPRLAITARVDVSDPEVEWMYLDALRELAAVSQSQAAVHLSAEVTPSTLPGRSLYWTGQIQRWSAWSAVAAGGLAALAVPGPVGASLGLVGLGAGALLAWKGVPDKGRRLLQAHRYRSIMGEQRPGGFEVGHLAGTPVPSDFLSLHQRSLKAFPGARQVAYLAGHGDGRRFAGLPMCSLEGQLKNLNAPLLIVDSCYSSQLAALCALPATVKAAVLCEGLHTERVGRVAGQAIKWGAWPRARVVAGLADGEWEPVEAARRVVQSAAPGPDDRSMVAVDLEAFRERLLPRLERLGRRFAVPNQEALQKARLLSRRSGLRDLGGYLRALAEVATDHDCRKEAQEALRCLKEVVVATRLTGRYAQDSGICFRAEPLREGSRLSAHPWMGDASS